MKRSTWVAVLVTAGVLVLAGNLPRLPLAAIGTTLRAGLTRQFATWGGSAQRPQAAAPSRHTGLYAATNGTARPARHTWIPVAPARLLATPMLPRAPRGRFELPAFPLLPVQIAVPALAGAFAGLIALLTLGLALRRDRRGQVWQLARRGFSPTRIARAARVPQDAVRTLLTPGLLARR